MVNAGAEVSFGEWLGRRRKAAGLTQAQLALQTGCSTSALKKIESEERRPSAQIVARLAEIFHIPPQEQAAFLRFARGDSGSAFTETIEESPWRPSPKSARSNIPATLTRLIGRGKEIEEIRDSILKPEIRLVSLLGPPGIGKTRLSIELARSVLAYFSDGVFFVPLAPLDDPTLIGVTIARALGYVGARNISPTEQLTEGIGEKQILLVPDNCEHLIEEVASLAAVLLSACPRLKLLATSRESLRIPGEVVYPVPALDVAGATLSINMETASTLPALTLFTERARAVRPNFALTSENIKTVFAICARLDGLPLAIELIAARMRVMSPAELLARLDDRFILSAEGMRAVPARQKTLENAIRWSYQLLSHDEQELFARLAVFSGGSTLEAAEAIFSQGVNGEKAVADLITSLLDKSLLQSTFNARGDLLFTMLVTIQRFALDQLQARGKEAETRHAWLAYMLDLSYKANQELRGPKQMEWLHRLDAMSDNLNAALEWTIETGQAEAALQLAGNLHWFWFVGGDHMGALRWYTRVLEMPDASQHPRAQAEALIRLAYHNVQLGQEELQEAGLELAQAVSIARANGNSPRVERALVMQGLALAQAGDLYTARTIMEKGKAQLQELGDVWGYADAMHDLAWLSVAEKDWATALLLFQQALAEFQTLGDAFFQSVALRYIGRCYVNLGDVLHGEAALCDSLLLVQQLDNKFQIALVLWRGFAEAALRAKQSARAAILLSASINIFQIVGAWTERDELLYKDELAECRAALGEAAFDAAMEQGRAMTIEQAAAYAFETMN